MEYQSQLLQQSKAVKVLAEGLTNLTNVYREFAKVVLVLAKKGIITEEEIKNFNFNEDINEPTDVEEQDHGSDSDDSSRLSGRNG